MWLLKTQLRVTRAPITIIWNFISFSIIIAIWKKKNLFENPAPRNKNIYFNF